MTLVSKDTLREIHSFNRYESEECSDIHPWASHTTWLLDGAPATAPLDEKEIHEALELLHEAFDLLYTKVDVAAATKLGFNLSRWCEKTMPILDRHSPHDHSRKPFVPSGILTLQR
jgi:hypothetical protein